MEIIETIKSNKLIIAGVVGVGALLFFVSKSASAETDTGTTDGMTNIPYGQQGYNTLQGASDMMSAYGNTPIMTAGTSIMSGSAGSAGNGTNSNDLSIARLQAETDLALGLSKNATDLSVAGILGDTQISLAQIGATNSLDLTRANNGFNLSALTETNKYALEKAGIDLQALTLSTNATQNIALDNNKTSMLLAQTNAIQTFTSQFKDQGKNAGGLSANFEDGKVSIGWLTQNNTQSVLAPGGNDTRLQNSNTNKTIASNAVTTANTLNKLPDAYNEQSSSFIGGVNNLLNGTVGIVKNNPAVVKSPAQIKAEAAAKKKADADAAAAKKKADADAAAAKKKADAAAAAAKKKADAAAAAAAAAAKKNQPKQSVVKK